MKLFLVMEDYQLNEIYSPTICGIYSTEKKAKGIKEDLEKRNPQYLYQYGIEERELDV